MRLFVRKSLANGKMATFLSISGPNLMFKNMWLHASHVEHDVPRWSVSFPEQVALWNQLLTNRTRLIGMQSKLKNRHVFLCFWPEQGQRFGHVELCGYGRKTKNIIDKAWMFERHA
jgi:hypothetical protein